jgi:hypothetical protein
MGVNGHEMDQDDDGTDYSVIISLHGNVGNAMMLYCQNPHHINELTEAYGVFCNNNGIGYSGAIERCDLDMLNGVGERYLIECLDMRDAQQCELFKNTEYISQSLAEIIVNIFYGESLGGGFTPPEPAPAPENGYTFYAEKGSWISLGEHPVIAFPTIEDAIAFNDNTVINEVFSFGELIAEYDTVYQDNEFNYVHWVSDDGLNRYAPTSKIGGDNKIGYFE